MSKILLFIVAIIIVCGMFAICSWFVSLLLNVVLAQAGLGSINTFGGACIVAAAQTIKSFILFGSK